MMRTNPVACASLIVLLAFSGAAQAQSEWGGTLGFLAGLPQGDFHDAVDSGFGMTGAGLWMPGSAPVGLRLGGSFLIYGSETLHSPATPYSGRVTVDVTTDNWIAAFEAGPELLARHGAVRPYAHVLAGGSYFSTTSELHDPDGYYGGYGYGHASSTNFDDWAFRLVAGGGIRFALGHEGRLGLDLGARYVWNSEVDYLTEGDIHDLPNGDIAFFPHRSKANLVELSIGVSWGGHR